MASSSSKGKRIKQRAQRHQEQVHGKLDFSKWFSSSEQIDRFTEHFQNRKLIAPRYCYLVEFTANGFQFPELFKAQNLVDIIVNSSNYYPDLVKVFYCNLEIRNGVIYSEVKKKKIVIDDDVFEEITGLKNEGEKVISGQKCPFDGYNKMEFYNSMCRYSFEEYKQKKRKLVSKKSLDVLGAGPLFPEDRLLHFFLNWIVIPKGSNHAQCSDFELQLMYGIKNNFQINWPFVIKNLMLKCQAQGDLAYAILISTIINHFGIDTSEENMIRTTIFDQRIGIPALAKLDIVYDEDDKMYKHKDDVTTPQEDPDQGAQEADAAAATTSAPPPSDSSLQLVIDKLELLHNSFNEFRDENRLQYEQLNQRLTAIEDVLNRQP